MSKKIRTLIVDDQPLFRELLEMALAPHPKVEIVGSVDNPQDAIRTALETRAEVVLMDIDLGHEMNGIEAARHIKQARPETGIVILSSHREMEFIRTVLEGRARGWSYLLKQSVGNADSIARAIEGSAWGYSTIDSAVLGDLEARPGQDTRQSAEGQMITVRGAADGSLTEAIARQVRL